MPENEYNPGPDRGRSRTECAGEKGDRARSKGFSIRFCRLALYSLPARTRRPTRILLCTPTRCTVSLGFPSLEKREVLSRPRKPCELVPPAGHAFYTSDDSPVTPLVRTRDQPAQTSLDHLSFSLSVYLSFTLLHGIPGCLFLSLRFAIAAETQTHRVRLRRIFRFTAEPRSEIVVAERRPRNASGEDGTRKSKVAG